MRLGGAFGAVAGASQIFRAGVVSTASAEEPMKVGFIKSITGKLASSNGPLFVTGRIAIEEINAAGGIMGRQISVVEEDDQGSPAREPEVVRKLSDADVRFVVGPVGSTQTLSTLGATQKNKMLQTAQANVPQVGDGVKYPYFYSLNFTTEQQAEAGVRYLADDLGIKKIGVIRDNNSFGELLGKGTVSALDRRGLKLVREEVFGYDAPDLGPYLANLKRAGVDGLLIWAGITPNVAQAMTALDRMQWYPEIAGHVSLLSDSLFELAPEAVLKKAYGTFIKNLSWTPTEPIGARQKAFAEKVAKYPEATRQGPLVASCPFYDYMYLLKQVIEQEKTFDIDKLKTALDNIKTFDGLLGPIRFTPQKHSGWETDQTVLVSAMSGRDPQAMNIFRQRATM